MKLNRAVIFTMVILLGCLSPFVNAGNKKKERTYTLPNGKVLINPYVISQNPNGLEVGHNNGIIKVQFKDLPEKIQKKYGYSPQKAAAYNKEQAKKKKELAKRKAEAARKEKIQDEKFRRYRRDVSMETMQINIKKTELRIAELKREIPRLEDREKTLLDNTTNMASTSVSGDNSDNRNYNSWYGGFSYSSSGNRAGNRAERTKQRQISKLDDEYAVTKHRLKTYKKELARKEIDLIKLKNHLEKVKKRKAKEKALPKK